MLMMLLDRLKKPAKRLSMEEVERKLRLEG